ncbi:hypothetical protein P4O66_011649 [Electrophorus voltai]|uniref:DUF4200 domain-containing protein n=1 Tax=Electrophorus voltai TaxID=2609070 RepID=A0AAD8Z8F4_9TELE|nr:hypothetical protein P4O66_011649 [Electrophorus voltai]
MDMPLPLNMDDPRLQLKVENRLKNIFVTQLEDVSLLHKKEHDENVRHIPVITESSSRVLDTGVNTLQRTLVLKKQVHLDEVNRQLMQKEQEFKGHMQALEQKWSQLQHKQQETKDKAAKFEKFVEENEVKRCRALKKYQVQRKQNQLMEKDISDLSAQLEQLQIRHQRLKARVDKHKIYEDYLMKILDLLPEKYLECGAESLVMPIIRRHETLSITQQDLLQRLASVTKELDEGQHKLDSLKQEHNTSKLAEETGSLVIAVKHLGQQCYLQHYGPLEDMDMLVMMDMIKEFIVEKVDMERRALRLTASGSEMMKGSANRRREGSEVARNASSKVHLKSTSKASGKSDSLSSSKTMQ